MTADGFNPLGSGPEEIGLREPETKPCGACGGLGYHILPAYMGGDFDCFPFPLPAECSACGGTGRVRADR